MAIEFQHVTKTFGDTRALEDVSLTLEKGKIYGLLGNNGAGKSTLLNILTGRLCPDSGTVTVDGAPAGSDAALSRLFLVGEKNLYPDDMKVKRALDTAELFYPDFDRAYAENLAKQFELPLNKKINSLSTGYGSIFRIVLGLSVNTPYVLFDEPVLGLDAQHRDLFYKLLVRKYAESPCTMVISTHLIADVEKVLDEVLKDALCMAEDQGSMDRMDFERVAQAMDMKILACSRRKKEDEDGIHYVSLEELLKESDYVSLHYPLTEETRHMIDKEKLALMKPTAFLINTARGALIDEKALIEALQNGVIAGAGLDVQEEEPPREDSPLYTMDNVVLTPHMGWRGLETRQRLINLTAENIRAYMDGKPKNVIVG